MEVEEAVEMGEEMLPQSKKIRLVVAPDSEKARSSKVDMNDSEQTASVLLYSSSGQLVRAEIVVDSLNENIVAVPVETDLAKRNKPPLLSDDGPEVLKILETPGQTPKKLKSNPLLVVRTMQSPATQSDSVVTKLITSSGHTRQKQVTLDSTAKSLAQSEVPTRTQSKASALCTKIAVSTETQQSSSQENLPPFSKAAVPAVEVKAHLSGFSEEHLPDFTSAIDKAVSQGGTGEDESSSSQTVMLRLNSLGGLELDPVFLSSDTLTEAQSEICHVLANVPRQSTSH